MRNSAIAAAIRGFVDAGALAGAAMLVWREGAVEASCVGWRDVEARLPIEPRVPATRSEPNEREIGLDVYRATGTFHALSSMP